MKIVKLSAENFLRLNAVEIKPDGHIVELTGKNAQGKTSVLNAIWAALDWAEATQTKPIKDGADKATITLDLGEYTVTRTFTLQEGGEFTTKLVVENKDKFRPQKPQTLLDSFLGDLSFDPMEFTRLKAREQFDALKKFVPGVDFDAIARERRKLFEERTNVNRLADEATSAAATIVEADAPAPIDETALIAKLDEAGKTNANIQADTARYLGLHQDIERKKGKVKEFADRQMILLEQLARLQDELTECAKHGDEWAAALLEAEKEYAAFPTIPPSIITTDLVKEIEAARQHNASIAEVRGRAARRKELEETADKWTKRSVELTEAIEQLDALKEKAVKEAKMPVPGISFGDDEILLNGQPFAQGSDAEQLRATIAIAAAMNPKLRVIRVHEGSHIDSDGMKIVQKFAEENDLQLWIETVESARPTAVVIEDGRVKK